MIFIALSLIIVLVSATALVLAADAARPDEQILLTPAEIEQIEAALNASPRIIPQVLDLRREFE